MSKRHVKADPKGFREQIVKPALSSGRRPREIAEEFEISVDSVRRRVKQAELDRGGRRHGLSTPEREELREFDSTSAACGWSARSWHKPRPGSLGRPVRSHPGLRIRKGVPVHLPHCHDVPRAGGFHKRLPCSAQATAQPAGARKRSLEPTDR